ncbi:MAG: 2Fe-2S iron-sulfur cluster binding domain-containing protein [Flavobacteriales bacterium]|nr:2Fe-2S iron-sulfur cluster binding domain-containing protein [Flavobacteriales bacterium]
MSHFHNLKVVEVTRETPEAVAVGFEIPADLKEEFKFEAGQYLTLSFNIGGSEERRAYSLCSSPSENILRVAVKEVEGGKVSTHVNRNLSVGDVVKVMPPQGNFTLKTSNLHAQTYVAFAAGSGITPILSMAKAVAENEPNSTFHIFYGNKDSQHVIFKSALEEMGAKNVKTTLIYSREDSGSALTNGRITEGKARSLVSHNQLEGAQGFFLCGPEEMIVEATKGLEALNIDKSKVHFELFTTPVLMESKSTRVEEASDFHGEAKITVIYDDEEFEFRLNTKGDSILETAIDNGVDVPFSCKGAVCCTCKAKVTEGRAVMDANYALTDDEVAQGYILTCTSHPVTERVVVNYDEV